MPAPARDRHAWAHAFMALLPEGPIWPRSRESLLYMVVYALMGIVERWGKDAWRFLNVEAFPPTSTPAYLLTDWERVLGLPEPCLPLTELTVAERQLQVREKLARRPGSQSRPYFISIAQRLGYHEPGPSQGELPAELPVQPGQLAQVTITEFRPFMAGVSRCGDSAWGIAPHRMRFVWRVNVPGARLTWFRCGAGGGRAGQDPHLRIARAIDLECLLNKLKPAHTKLIFSYTGI